MAKIHHTKIACDHGKSQDNLSVISNDRLWTTVRHCPHTEHMFVGALQQTANAKGRISKEHVADMQQSLKGHINSSPQVKRVIGHTKNNNLLKSIGGKKTASGYHYLNLKEDEQLPLHLPKPSAQAPRSHAGQQRLAQPEVKIHRTTTDSSEEGECHHESHDSHNRSQCNGSAEHCDQPSSCHEVHCDGPYESCEHGCEEAGCDGPAENCTEHESADEADKTECAENHTHCDCSDHRSHYQCSADGGHDCEHNHCEGHYDSANRRDVHVDSSGDDECHNEDHGHCEEGHCESPTRQHEYVATTAGSHEPKKVLTTQHCAHCKATHLQSINNEATPLEIHHATKALHHDLLQSGSSLRVNTSSRARHKELAKNIVMPRYSEGRTAYGSSTFQPHELNPSMQHKPSSYAEHENQHEHDEEPEHHDHD